MSDTFPDICAVAEVLTYLGLDGSATDAQLAKVALAKKMAESAVRTFVGYPITQRVITGELLNDKNLSTVDADYIDVVNNRVQLYGWSDTVVMRAQQIPVRSVQACYADLAALGGQGPSDFGSSTLLIQGTDYYLDFDIVTDATPNAKQGISFTGEILRWPIAWPYRRRSVLLNYTAGFSAAELDGNSGTNWNHYKDPQAIKWATIEAVVAQYWTMDSFNANRNLGVGIGAVTMEKVGDASFSYDASIASVVGMQCALPPAVQCKLGPFRRMSVR